MFRRGGEAGGQMNRIDEVELVFDARGYARDQDRSAARISERGDGRITFKFLAAGPDV